MARKPQVDVRKLKDEVADYLKKSKFEKAAEVLEQLVVAEPKDMSHQLKLGDAYRRLEQPERAIGAYQHAAKHFADQGQLIKAIGAVKIVLEIDPRNAEAQRHLGEMNERRMGKATLESAGLKSKPGIGAGARATSPIELEEAHAAADAVGGAMQQRGIELDESDDTPMELEDANLTKPIRPAAPRAVIAPPPPPPDARDEFVLPEEEAPQPRREIEMDLDPEVPSAEPEQLPDDAILTPQAEDLIAAPGDEEVLPGDYPSMILPAIPSEDAPPPQPARPPRGKARKEPVSVSDGIEIDLSPSGKRGGGPIADLLGSGAEEEIELLSTSTDETPAAEPETAAEEEEDLDAAFDRVAPAGPRAKRVPVKKVPLFDDLSQEAFVELVNRVGYHRHAAGQLIIREGDPGRSFFIIVEGKVRIFKAAKDGSEITLAHLGEGAFFGEMALLSGAPRTANVVAEEDTEILEVTDVVLRELAGKHPQVVSSLKSFYRQRLLNNVMAISPLFKDFDPSERKSIVEKFRMRPADAGEMVIKEGRNSDGLYVVLHGSVQVSTRKDRQEIELARLKEGDIFGEMSLLTRKPATATVTAAGNSILLRLPRESFQELVVTHPQILELVSELTERRKSATEAILHGQGEGHDGMSFV